MTTASASETATELAPRKCVAPTMEGVRAAAARLSGKAVRTPLIENLQLNEFLGGRVLLKLETFQHCGAFKFRGAYNFMAQLPENVRAKGVVAWSSGNHGQGVALAAKMYGAPATIVMPEDAPLMKADMIRRLGAEIVFYDRYKDDREAIGRELSSARGMALAPSYDHPHIIEGQGTVGIEIAEQAAAMGVDLDAVVVCCGGGGLTAGVSLGLAASDVDANIYIAEPEGYDETLRSLASGRRETADLSLPTICDAIATPTPGEITFPILKHYVTGGAALSEADVAAAMSFAYRRLKCVVEPGGAVALAAVLSSKVSAKGKTVAVTLSGGNVDLAVFTKLLSEAPEIA